MGSESGKQQAAEAPGGDREADHPHHEQVGDVAFIAIYRFALIPLFLFSGTFFPVTRLPGWLQPVAYATPLYHGVALCRGLVLGTAELWPSLGSALYLVVLTGLGYLLAQRTFRRRLVV